MSITETPIYQKAFEHYLRHGTPLEISIKALGHETPYYIWVTAGDDKVRTSHAANNGKVFAWDNPPSTGNPGDAPHCRCIGIPYQAPAEPGLDGVYPELLLLPGSALFRRLGGEIIRRVVREPESLSAQLEPRDILAPHGQPIGKPGMRPEVRVEGGGDKAARELFERLSKGGKPDTPKNYPGAGVRLPNGDWVGYRAAAKSGSPTIDVDVKGVNFDKIHFN